MVVALSNAKSNTLLPNAGTSVRAVVLSPTRELTLQIHTEALKLCNGCALRAVVVYGGTGIRQQLKELAHGCDICVATPGRLRDFVNRGVVKLAQVNFLVLDEADRMLDMGFEPQIRQLVQQFDMPQKHKRCTFMFR
jgi:ATP-dependent RNA helicase DDX3X